MGERQVLNTFALQAVDYVNERLWAVDYVNEWLCEWKFINDNITVWEIADRKSFKWKFIFIEVGDQTVLRVFRKWWYWLAMCFLIAWTTSG